MKMKQLILNPVRNVSLTSYLMDVGGKFALDNRPAVLILPGGAYQYCSDREADPVAMAYMQAGFHAFILRYSVAEHMTWPNPLDDVEQAMALIRANADKWHVCPNKIAVIGFSAGGHLAAAAATMTVNRPNAAIIGYGVVGNDVKGCNPTAPDTTLHVDHNTCPCFLFSSRTDPLVPVLNSVEFMDALCRHDVAFESHIYAYGPHGFSTCDSAVQDLYGEAWCSRIPRWVEDSVGWLKDMFGDFRPGEGLLPPACGAHANGNWDETLSIDCTLGHLTKNPAALPVVQPILDSIAKIAPGDGARKFFDQLPLRTTLGYSGLTQAQIDALNAALHAIPNR